MGAGGDELKKIGPNKTKSDNGGRDSATAKIKSGHTQRDIHASAQSDGLIVAQLLGTAVRPTAFELTAFSDNGNDCVIAHSWGKIKKQSDQLSKNPINCFRNRSDCDHYLQWTAFATAICFCGFSIYSSYSANLRRRFLSALPHRFNARTRPIAQLGFWTSVVCP